MLRSEFSGLPGARRVTLGGVLALPPFEVHVALTHGRLQSLKGDERRVVIGRKHVWK